MELADMLDLGSSASRHAGSTPVIRTKFSRWFYYEAIVIFYGVSVRDYVI